jgi:hypothetical protein
MTGSESRSPSCTAQSALSAIQRLEILGQLAGGVAHDFDNLLTVILGDLAIVRQDLAGATETDWPDRLKAADSDLSQVTRACEWAADLTRRLVGFARGDGIGPQALDLNAVVGTVEEMLRRTLGEQIELVSSLDDQLWPVLADPGQLEQVLVNLVLNARDAMPSGGIVTIDTSNSIVDAYSVAGGSESPEGHCVRLRVSDTGVGMPPEVAERVFEPFFTTKDSSGTGLGLASAHGILTQNNGHVKLYSEPGVGTTFSITLPAVVEAAIPRALPTPWYPTPRGETVLIVEDDAAVLQVTKRILIRHGYRVITAADGTEAIQIARNCPSEIQLLIADAIMPYLPGKALAAKIQAIRPEIEVLFMSGYARPVLTSHGRLDPGMTLVDKPFSESDLLNKVGQVLGNRSGLSEYATLLLEKYRSRPSAA